MHASSPLIVIRVFYDHIGKEDGFFIALLLEKDNHNTHNSDHKANTTLIFLSLLNIKTLFHLEELILTHQAIPLVKPYLEVKCKTGIKTNRRTSSEPQNRRIPDNFAKRETKLLRY